MSVPRPPIGYRLLLLLVGYARQRPARTAKPGAKWCKIVQKGAIGSRRGLAEPMILSPHHSVCGRETAPSTLHLGNPSVPSVCSCSSPPCFSGARQKHPPKPAKLGFGFRSSPAFQLSAFPISRFPSRFSGQVLVKFGNMTLSSTKRTVSSTGPKRGRRPAPASHGRVGRKMKIPQTLPFCAKTCQELTPVCAQERLTFHENSSLGARWCFLVLSGGHTRGAPGWLIPDD
jgi:hypothetical protein